MLYKGLVGSMAVSMLFVMTSTAFALQDPAGESGNIIPNQIDKVDDSALPGPYGTGTYDDYVQGATTGLVYTDTVDVSTLVYGSWNSPYTLGVDGYNYNDPQDYVGGATQVDVGGVLRFQSGPHGGYLTSTHRCRECHAVHRAAGKFKLLRSDTRFEACDWCHGNGAGSGFNIQMDNDDNYTTEYNVGHTMGFGIESGKWKAPDDTFPAFTPNYWQGGFSCFDCHSPHANPKRMLGYNDAGVAVGYTHTDGKVYGVVNPGHGGVTEGAGDSGACSDCHKTSYRRPLYLSGSWLLIKNADREVATVSTTVASGISGDDPVTITAGAEISDKVIAGLTEFDTTTPYPVNKIPIDWNTPIGVAGTESSTTGYNVRNTDQAFWNVSEFCTDCHDGNAGLHTTEAPLFSEDRALRNSTDTSSKADYELAYGHDAQPRHCARQMKFDPQDGEDFGPHCRNCHKGSSSCGRCHGAGSYGFIDGDPDTAIWTSDTTKTADNSFDRLSGIAGAQGSSTYNAKFTSIVFVEGVPEHLQIIDNMVAGIGSHWDSDAVFMFKKLRTVEWASDWRTTTTATTPGTANGSCSDDGFSWPHRTLGWKMLKDDLFGLDFDGTPIEPGQIRRYDTDGNGFDNLYLVHDLDSVCLDCHNPTVWGATSAGDHVDNPADPNDNHDDELLTRGLP